jgi:hypothetical protein
MKLGEIFDWWETIPEMAEDIGVPHGRVKKWRQRRRIPDEYWSDLVSAASRKGKKLSADDLLGIHSRLRNASARVSR